MLALGLFLGVMMVAFEITAVLTALPSITDQLGGDSLYGLALACYTLANLVALVATGELTDRFGPARPYLASLAVFAFGLVLAATAHSMVQVVIGRTLQGAGTGGLAPIAYVMVKRAFPEDRQAGMYAFLSAGWVIPSLIAPAIAGAITERFGWRWVFWGLLPLIPVVVVATVRPMATFGPTAAAAARRSRVGSAFAAAGGIGLFVTALQFTRPVAAIGGSLAGAALALPALRRLLPGGVHRVVTGLPAAMACRVLATAAFIGADGFIPLAAARIHHSTPTVQGFIIIGASLTWTTGQLLVARRRDLDPRRAVRWGFAIMAIGIAASAPVVVAGWPLWATFVSWGIGGLGMGLSFNPITVTAMSHAQDGTEGLVGGQVSLAEAIGFSTMGGIGGATVAIAERTRLSVAGALGINFALAVGLAVLGIAWASRIRAAAQ